MLKFKTFRCGHCNSRKVEKGYYSRGWNNYCGQAYGDYGYFCNKCYKISWIKTYKQARLDAPDWCTVNKSTTTTINFKNN